MATDDERPDPREPTVKQLLAGEPAVDPQTAAQLARWFALPSFEQLAERPPPPPDDPEMIAAQARRDKAIAAVDLVWLERHRVRTEDEPEALLKFVPSIDLRVDPDITMIDIAMIERKLALAEPREVEISEDLRDDLKEVTPQALLRDLHRAEIDFDKTFERMPAERFDIVAEIASAMTTDLRLPPLALLGEELRQVRAEIQADRLRPWTDVLKLTLANRTVSE